VYKLSWYHLHSPAAYATDLIRDDAQVISTSSITGASGQVLLSLWRFLLAVFRVLFAVLPYGLLSYLPALCLLRGTATRPVLPFFIEFLLIFLR
jgi:hypothetical protein